MPQGSASITGGLHIHETQCSIHSLVLLLPRLALHLPHRSSRAATSSQLGPLGRLGLVADCLGGACLCNPPAGLDRIQEVQPELLGYPIIGSLVIGLKFILWLIVHIH